eukprot:757095-Hanusia_phi.AAC.2
MSLLYGDDGSSLQTITIEEYEQFQSDLSRLYGQWKVSGRSGRSGRKGGRGEWSGRGKEKMTRTIRWKKEETCFKTFNAPGSTSTKFHSSRSRSLKFLACLSSPRGISLFPFLVPVLLPLPLSLLFLLPFLDLSLAGSPARVSVILRSSTSSLQEKSTCTTDSREQEGEREGEGGERGQQGREEHEHEHEVG